MTESSTELSPEAKAGAIEFARGIVQKHYYSLQNVSADGTSEMFKVLPSNFQDAGKSPLARRCILELLEQEKRSRITDEKTGYVDRLKRRREQFDRNCAEISGKRVSENTKRKKLIAEERTHQAEVNQLQREIDKATELLARPRLVYDKQEEEK